MSRLLNLLLVLAFVVVFVPVAHVNAATLTSGSATLTDSRNSATSVTYDINFSTVTTSTIKCIRVAFSDATTGGAKPTGMTITSAAFSATSDYIPTPASWTVSNNNTTGVTSITYVTGETPASATSRNVILTGITNGSTAGTAYYIQFSTYNNTDCASSQVDTGTIAYIYTAGQSVTIGVDPTLAFSVAGVASGQTVNGVTTSVTTTSTTIPFGTVTTATNKIGAQDLTITTNAGGGYTVTTQYTGAPSNGTGGTILDFTGTNAAPATFSAAGTSAFGYTTADTTLGTGTASRFSGSKFAKWTTSGLEVAYNNAAVSETVRVGYQIGISGTTPAGAYTTTIVFTATPVY